MIKLPKMPSLKLNNRRALITGAYGGLGLGCSAVLADAGAHVVVSGPNEKKLKIRALHKIASTRLQLFATSAFLK